MFVVSSCCDCRKGAFSERFGCLYFNSSLMKIKHLHQIDFFPIHKFTQLSTLSLLITGESPESVQVGPCDTWRAPYYYKKEKQYSQLCTYLILLLHIFGYCDKKLSFENYLSGWYVQKPYRSPAIAICRLSSFTVSQLYLIYFYLRVSFNIGRSLIPNLMLYWILIWPPIFIIFPL